MERFRLAPPVELAGLPLARVRDYARHEIRTLPANRKSAGLPQPHGDLVIFETSPEAGCAITFAVRPSGTEPKIKFYFFARAPVPAEGALPAVKAATDRTLAQAQAALLEWIEQALAASG
jgi:phosphoglucomutase/phosphomannomutase